MSSIFYKRFEKHEKGGAKVSEIVARRVIENGEEILCLDLNKPWPKRKAGYSNYMDDVDKLVRKPRKTKEFIEILN